MKWLLFFLMAPFQVLLAQGDSSYYRLLGQVKELEIRDSLTLSTYDWTRYRLDTNEVKTWFPSLLGSGKNNRLKNRHYYLAGKITSNPGYDLVFLIEEKKKTDSVEVASLHLFTRKKQGSYISSLEVAISRTKKQANHLTSTVLYPDFSIRKHSQLLVNEKEVVNKETYKINPVGRFILQEEN